MTTTPESTPRFYFGSPVPFGPDMEEFSTPAFVEIAATGQRFHWDPEQGCYEGLYIEPGFDGDGHSLTQESYFEIES